MPSDRSTLSRSDVLLGGLVAVGAVLYLAALPRNLNPSDEAIHLYEAKRLLGGEVMYRDVFEIITPGWMYLMALLFQVFGTDMATARIGMAVIHAGTMLMIGIACRRLGVRAEIAWTAAFAFVAVCQAAWPIASQHWLSTFLCVLLLLVLLRNERRRLVAMLSAGAVLGLLIGVQQQRGVIMAAGVAAWLMVDGVVDRRLGARQPAPSVWKAPAALAAGIGIVVVPLLLGLIAAAGFEPVWRALVVHPLINYAVANHCEWGHVNFMTAPQAQFTYPTVLRYLPLIFMTLVPRLVNRARRRDGEAVRRLLLLLAFSLTSMASIAYFPDFIHIAFIAPVFFVAIAESFEWFLSALPVSTRLHRAGGLVVAAALAGVFAWQLQQNFARLWRIYPIAIQTSFGRIDLARPIEAQLYERVDGLLRDVPSRQLFCYPITASLYLMANAHNPTRYGFLRAGYTSSDQMQEVVDVLKAARLPYIVALPVRGFVKPGDPVFAYLEQEYEPLGSSPVDSFIFRPKAPS
jgi:hypothetical protein